MNGDFVFVDELVPGIRWDSKYATWDNFTGKPVDGYLANRIVGTRALCAALALAREHAASFGFGLAAVGRLPSAAWRRLLRALVGPARGWPHQAAPLPEPRATGDVRARLRRQAVGAQPRQHRRPHPVPPRHGRPRGDGWPPRPHGSGLAPRHARGRAARGAAPSAAQVDHGRTAGSSRTARSGGTTRCGMSRTPTPTSTSRSRRRSVSRRAA